MRPAPSAAGRSSPASACAATSPPTAAQDVCALCEAGAERLGWKPEGAELEEPQDEAAGQPPARPAPLAAPSHPGLPGAGAGAQSRSPRDDPAAAGMRSEGAREEVSPLSPFERAVARFNASEAGRTVAGLVRTLGEPPVSVGASAGAPTRSGSRSPGSSPGTSGGSTSATSCGRSSSSTRASRSTSSTPPARQWNASAVEGGRIVLAAPAGDAPERRAGAPLRHEPG